MTKAEEEKFQALREMFNSKGWKYFLEDVEDNLKALLDTAPDVCYDGDTWQITRGKILKARELLGYQNLMEYVEQQMEEEDA